MNEKYKFPPTSSLSEHAGPDGWVTIETPGSILSYRPVDPEIIAQMPEANTTFLDRGVYWHLAQLLRTVVALAGKRQNTN
ncbi:hypothetical protein KBC79_02755 [Candidatus Woesebacteria bacterium]|nr:hypothetical protein [Candidatus Woesebacteria bacterium]